MPDLSIVIPFKDDFFNLKLCLESLKKQKARYSYEIIAIDDGSSKRHNNEITSLGLKNLYYFYQKNKGPAAARNLGIKKSKSELIAFIDSDCIAEKNWAAQIIESFKKNREIGIIGGRIDVDKKNLYALASQYLTSNAMYDNVNGKRELIFMPTCNLAVKKSIFDKVGYFDEDFKLPAGEDLEFCWRAFKKGVRFNYEDNIVVFHNLKKSLNSYVKQAFRYGRGNYLVRLKHPDQPELKSIKLGSKFNFFLGCLIDLLDGPRFAWVFTGKIGVLSLPGRINLFSLYIIHKYSYVFGNVKEKITLK